MAAWERLNLVSFLEIIQADCTHLVLETIPTHIADPACPDLIDLLKGETPVPALIEKLIWLGI